MSRGIYRVQDKMRGRPDQAVTLRLNREDAVDLPCNSGQYPCRAQCTPGKLRVLKRVEVSDGTGEWIPYPTVVYLDGIERADQLVSRALVLDAEGNISAVSSPQGVLDEELMAAAEATGLYTESFDGK